MPTVLMQPWKNRDSWSMTIEDAGQSFHLTMKDRDAYLQAFYDSQPASVPEAYDYADGEPVEIEVGKKLYNEIKKSRRGIRGYYNVKTKKGKKKKKGAK